MSLIRNVSPNHIFYTPIGVHGFNFSGIQVCEMSSLVSDRMEYNIAPAYNQNTSFQQT